MNTNMAGFKRCPKLLVPLMKVASALKGLILKQVEQHFISIARYGDLPLVP